MPVTGYWGPKQFVVSENKIVPFDGLKISQAVKVETQNNANGNSVSNIKGKDAMEVSMKVAYYAPAGANPISEMNGWLNLLGKSHPLFIGSQQIGSGSLTLHKVQIDDEMHTNSGEFIGLSVAITLKEFSAGTKISSSGSGSSGSSSGSGGDKTASLRASPPKEEKKERNPRDSGSGGNRANNKVVMLN